MNNFTEALGIDIGTKRIGVARVNAIALIPQPLETVIMSEDAPQLIKQIAEREGADLVVVGLPATKSGEDSDQTLFSREFAAKLEDIGLIVVLQDETLSTHEASELIKNGRYSRSGNSTTPGLDEVAACVILNDYITHGENKHV